MSRPRANGSHPVRVVPGHGAAPGLESEHPAGWNRTVARVLAIASGRDGVGRSTLAVNLALALGERGARVVLVDGDLANGQLDLLLGVHPRWDVSHLLSGECTLEEVLVPAGRNVRLLPAATTAPELAELDDIRRETLLRSFGHLDANADWIVLDTGASASPQSLEFCRAAHELIIVCTPEMPALADAYALLKRLHGTAEAMAPHVVVNLATTADEAETTSQQLGAFARHFLSVELGRVAAVPEDAAVRRAARAQEPVLTAYPDSPAARAFRALAAQMWKPAPDDPTQVVDVDHPQRLEA